MPNYKLSPVVVNDKVVLDPSKCPINGVNEPVTAWLYELSLTVAQRYRINRMVLVAENEQYRFYSDSKEGYMVRIGKSNPRHARTAKPKAGTLSDEANL
jgi:hypothetical protein